MDDVQVFPRRALARHALATMALAVAVCAVILAGPAAAEGLVSWIVPASATAGEAPPVLP